MPVTVRSATALDAEEIASMGREFVAYLRGLGDETPSSMTAEAYLRDGFCEKPAFAGLVAEWEGRVAGYLLYSPAYDLDLGGRIHYVFDLFVRQAARRRGVGRALMTRAVQVCRQAGGSALLWSVYAPNKEAAAFYAHLGGQPRDGLEFMAWRW